MNKNASFAEHNYPKSFGSIKKNNYRLKDYSKLSEKALEKIEGKLWDFIYKRAEATEPLKYYKKYDYLAAGWEWSVFKKDKDTLIKVPAQVFSEVNEPTYLNNTKLAYKKILDYFPKEFVARTQFQRINQLNTLEQQFIKGDDSFLIDFQNSDKILLTHLANFLDPALRMLSEYEWLPDFDIKRTNDGFTLRNVVIERDSSIPKIIDFTAYYDVYRMYRERKDYEVKEKAREIKEFIKWLKDK